MVVEGTRNLFGGWLSVSGETKKQSDEDVETEREQASKQVVWIAFASFLLSFVFVVVFRLEQQRLLSHCTSNGDLGPLRMVSMLHADALAFPKQEGDQGVAFRHDIRH